ncbi:unnamed protein product [Polarella glacialis]|uniref:Uncharacterized protein n=2 Tax=Polarella glacialis TaxID=89957 RepID=A0A813GSY8_POLGL|nr:unnamed protein product [Polarella glacialis]
MPPRGSDLTQQVIVNSIQLQQQFKSISLRKAEFKRQKSVLIEKELQVHFKAANDTTKRSNREADGASSPSRPSSAGRTYSPKAKATASAEDNRTTGGVAPSRPVLTHGHGAADDHWLSRSWSSPSATNTGAQMVSRLSPRLSTKGAVHSRFGSSYPPSSHPSVHPGALSIRPPSTPPSSSGARLRQLRTPQGGSGGGWATGPEALQASLEESLETGYLPSMARARGRSRTESSTSMPPSTAPGPLSPGGSNFAAAQRRARAPGATVSFSSGFGLGSEAEDQLWLTEPSREELLFAAAEQEAAALADQGSEQGGRLSRPPDPPDMIERLGDLMALLGPRYRTLPREAVWEKAVVGSTTPLQRREKRLGSATVHASLGSKGHRGQHRRTAGKRQQSPETLDLDPDGTARAAWLTARDRENEVKARASSLPT